MNREILFKAKRKDNGEWIQGYYYQIWQQGYILWGMINNMPDMVEVNPNTLCQYTGLTDKNGKKIWEEIEEATFQEDTPVYIGDMAVDGYVRASRVKEIIRAYMDDCKTFEFDFTGVKSFDCQCGRHYVNTCNDGWISVEEKLPEKENERYYPMLNVATSYGAVKWGFYRVRDKEWYIYSEKHDEFIKAKDKEIVAWQPLPEPYKGGKENE